MNESHNYKNERSKNSFRYGSAARIQGTDKVRTYCANPMQYSEESDLRNLCKKQYREYHR